MHWCKYLVRTWIFFLHSMNSANYREHKPVMTPSALGPLVCSIPSLLSLFNDNVLFILFHLPVSAAPHFTVPHPPLLQHLDFFLVVKIFISFLLWLLWSIFLVIPTIFEIHHPGFVDNLALWTPTFVTAQCSSFHFVQVFWHSVST